MAKDDQQLPTVVQHRDPIVATAQQPAAAADSLPATAPPLSAKPMGFADPLRFVTLEWLTPIMFLGAKRPLQSEDLLRLADKDRAANLANVLDGFWADFHKWSNDKNEPSANRNPANTPKLFGYVFKTFISVFLAGIFFQSIAISCSLTIPTFIKQVVIYFQFLVASPQVKPFISKALYFENGIAFAFILFGLQLVASITGRTCEQIIRRLEVNIRTILIGAIYEKSLRLSSKSSNEFSQGQILQLVNVDSEKVALAIQSLNGLYGTPIQIVVAVVLLGKELGYAVWAGAGTLFAVLLLQGSIIGFLVKFQQMFLKAGDLRLKTIRETLYGMKIIKFRALEEFFEARITAIRNNQVSFLKNFYIIQVFFVGLLQITPVAMPIVAFIAYSLLTGSLSAPVIFASLALFNILFQPLLVLPSSLTGVVVAIVSWNRIRQFLLAEEAAPFEIADPATNPNVAFEIKNGVFRWDSEKTANTDGLGKKKDGADDKASDKDAKKKPARSWGRKKAAEAETAAPAVDASKDAADANPSAVLDPNDENNYFHLRNINVTVKKGSLVAVVGPVGSGKSSFLSSLIGEMRRTEGDLNIYGSLAYCAQQPWILTETIQGNILFNNAMNDDRMEEVLRVCCLSNDLRQFPAGRLTEIGEKGVNLSGGQKARVALARALYHDADTFLLDDPISALDAQVGAEVFKQAIQGMLKDKTVVLVTHQLHLLPEVDEVIVLDKGTVAEQGTFASLMAKPESVLSDMMKSYKLDDAVEKTTEDKKEKISDKAEDKEGGGVIIADEDRFVGAVKSNTYWSYVKACGGIPYLVTVATAAILAQATRFFTDLWLTWWTEDRFKLTVDEYLRYYSLLGGSQVVFSLVLNTTILIGGYNAARYFHGAALKRLMRAPMSYFDSQPIGRILNRLSKDVDSVDQLIWLFLFLTIISFTGLLSFMILICYTVPYMVLLIIPLVVLYYFILKYYQNANRELKRLESIHRSPLYAHVSETLAGISTVKAFRVEGRFVTRQRLLMDYSNSPNLLKLLGSVWVNLRIELLASTVILTLVLLGSTSTINPSQIGLALVYAIGLTGLINLLLIAFSQLEAELNSVERLDLYANTLPQEAARVTDRDLPEGQWPTKGAISIQDLEIRYESRPDYAVLRDLSLDILPGENVGIVGRTGSGKSTLMTALFRIVEPSKGTITIDGQDICQLGLKTLRSRLQIIPQEPVLFTGTVRANLDVESKYTDADVWDVLERIGLKDYVSSLPDKLESPVTENGENLSVGQRQLICLGRAILMKPVVLIMDEATASVDAEADKLIQESIKTNFKHTTVLSIAHRLNTIADFDRVLVLQDGVKVEFDTPHVLLNRPQSLFSQLADATGPANAQLLRDIAANKAAASASL